MRTLHHASVDVWILFASDVTDSNFEKRCTASLSEVERRRSLRFVSRVDAQMFVLSHGLLRAVLSQYAAEAPEAWSFGTTGRGKPCLPRGSPYEWLNFNLSHTHGAAAVVVARAAQVGVDIESAKPDMDMTALATRFFSSQESAEIRRKQGLDRLQAFYRSWTLKEAYVKARGEGLSLPLDQFRFELTHGDRIRFFAEAQLDMQPHDWCFSHARLGSRHFLSVCAGDATADTHFNLLQCNPHEEHLSPKLLVTLGSQCAALASRHATERQEA